MRKPELALTALGVIIAALALIPAFGQWLFPRESPQFPPTPTPVQTAATLTVTNPPPTTPPVTEVHQPTPESPTPTVATSTNLLPGFTIAVNCGVAEHLLGDLPSSPLVAQYEADAQHQQEVLLVKDLIVAAMEVASHAAYERDARCVSEFYAGQALQDLEIVIAGDPTEFLRYKLRIEWADSQLLDLRTSNAGRMEADVCLFQGLDVFDLQGIQTMTFPAEFAAATYILEHQIDNRYYITSIVELDSFNLCPN